MRHIQSRLLLWFLLLSLLPTALVGILSYAVSGRVIRDKATGLAEASLEQLAENLDGRFERINLYFDLFANTRALAEILRTTDFFAYDYGTYKAYMAIDPTFQKYLRFPSHVVGAAFYSGNGTIYNYGTYFTDIAAVKGLAWYRGIVEAGDKVAWFGIYPSPVLGKKGDPNLVAGRSFRDLAFKGDLANLGVLAFFIDARAILDLPPGGTSLATACVDAEGRILVGGGPIVQPLSEYPFAAQVLSASRGSFPADLDGKRFTLLFHAMNATGWKVIQLIPMDYYMGDLRTIGSLTLAVELASVAAVLLLAFLLARGFSRPINDLARAFVLVGRNDFSVKVFPRTGDEIGRICHEFNDMTVKLRDLFDQAVERERTLKDAELRALRYQINPHFIYNSLSTVRFTAMKGDARTVADMLLVLTRLFKNTITRTAEMVSVREAEANLRDYLAILQMQYSNALEVRVESDPAALDCLIPVLILQPVVENAVLHGLSERLNLPGGDARLAVRFEADGTMLRAVIRDNGSGMSDEEVQSALGMRRDLVDKDVKIGLANIQARIRGRFGDGYGLEVRSEKGLYTEVRLNLPRIQGDGGAPCIGS